jgi:hypothetical protein
LVGTRLPRKLGLGFSMTRSKYASHLSALFPLNL